MGTIGPKFARQPGPVPTNQGTKMPEINDSTPRRKIQIGGVVLSAPTPYAEGHVLNANEAGAINQTYLENIGNNFRSAVTKAKKFAILGKSEATAEELKTVTDAQIKDFDKSLDDEAFATNFVASQNLQASLDELVANYQMGVRRTSSVEVVDPVTREARGIAKNMLKASLQKKGIKLNTVSAEWYDREIAKLLDKENPVIRGEVNKTANIWAGAEAAVAARKGAAEESLDELDLTDMEKSEEDEEEQEQEASQE
jgi:hypothetical protein